MTKRWFRCLMLLMLLALLLPALPAQAGGDSVLDLIASSALSYKTGAAIFYRRDGHIIGDNEPQGDVALLSGIRLEKGQHVRLETAAIVQKGTAFGIIVAEHDVSSPFRTGWFCVNADLQRGDSRLLAYGAGAAARELGGDRVHLADPNIAAGQTITLALEILPDGTLLTSCNGQEYSGGSVRFEGYSGGYPGIMTYRGKVEFLSATLTYVGAAPQDGQPAASETVDLIGSSSLLYKSDEESSFETDDSGVLSARNKGIGGALFLGVPRVYSGQHAVLSATGVIREGRAFGILLHEGERLNKLSPGQVCVCADAEAGQSRLSARGTAADDAIGDGKAARADSGIAPGREVTLALEFLPDGTVHASCNGQEYTQGAIRYDAWPGGFPGLMTDQCDVDITSFTLTRMYYAAPARP